MKICVTRNRLYIQSSLLILDHEKTWNIRFIIAVDNMLFSIQKYSDFSYFSTKTYGCGYSLDWLIVLGLNAMSTPPGYFVSFPREREKRNRRGNKGDEREGQGKKRNRNESEETEETRNVSV